MAIYFREHADIFNPDSEPDPVAVIGQLEHHRATGDPLQPTTIEAIANIVSGYYLAEGPKGPTSHGNPRRYLSERLIGHTRRRVMKSIREWQKNRRAYKRLPTRLIEAWFKNEVNWYPVTLANAFTLGEFALEGTKFEAKQRTLENVLAAKHELKFGNFAVPPRSVLEILRLPDPETLFGPPSIEMSAHVKAQLEPCQNL